MSFPEPLFTNITNAEQRVLRFHKPNSNRTSNPKNMDEMSEYMAFNAPIFTKFSQSVEFCGHLPNCMRIWRKV